MSAVRITWIDSVTAGVLGTKIFRDDVEIGDVGNGVQVWDDLTADPDTTYKYEVQAYTATGQSTGEVQGVNVDNITTLPSYGLGNATYDGIFLDVAALDPATLNGVSEQGGKLWILNNVATIYRFSIVDDNDISTATDDSNSYPLGAAMQDWDFKPDGLRLISVNNSNKIFSRDMSIAWSLTSLGVSSTVDLPGGVEGRGMMLSPDGTFVLVLDNGLNTIRQYNMSTPYDINTISYSGIELDVSAQGTNLKSMQVSPDGAFLEWADASNDFIYQYSLITPWDISTAVFNGGLSTAPNIGVTSGMTWNIGGNKFLMSDNVSYRLFQYSTNNG